MALIKARRQPAATGQPDDAARPSPAALAGRLGHADAAERRAALRAVAALPVADSAPLVPALAARIGVEDDAVTSELLFTTLVRIGSADAAAVLVPLMGLEDVGLRNAAIEALRQMPPGAVAPHIPLLLDDDNADLRIFTVQLIGRIDHDNRVDWLNRILRDETEKNVCLAAVEALAERYCAGADDALRALPARFPDDPFVEFSVVSVRALHRFGED